MSELRIGPIKLPFSVPVPEGFPTDWGKDDFLPPRDKGKEGFGRTVDSYLPPVVQWGAVTIEGAIRSVADRLINEEGPTPDTKSVTSNLDRSSEAFRALDDEHGIIGTSDRYHTSKYPWRTEAWPLGQVLHGRVLEAMNKGDWDSVENLMREFESYRRQDGFNGGISAGLHRYYDDNAWIGIAAMQAHGATNDDRYLEHAKRTFEMVATGVHPDGGLYWYEQDRSGRHTCSVAPAAQLAMQIYEATGEDKYLQFAQSQAEWLNANLRDERGLYLDNVKDSGKVENWVFSYNQGTPLGLDLQLYKATGEEKYLKRAQETAEASMKHFDADKLWKQAPVFNAVYLRNMLALNAEAPNPEITKYVDAYLERLWSEGRNSETGLFDQNGIGAYEKGNPGSVIDQGGIAQLFAARALPPEKQAELT